MSGFIAILQRDGGMVDPHLLASLTGSMVYHAPDAPGIWPASDSDPTSAGPVGLGHTLLRTTPESAQEQQPLSLDGQVWIVADARVDGRDVLMPLLRARGRTVLAGAPDVELILHAYHTWGADCARYLLGDFAFVIWDSRERRLFGGRDHVGVKPFYYSLGPRHLVLSNNLACLLQHPAVSEAFDEQTIGDFLFAGANIEAQRTFFAGCKALPPAHTLNWSAGSLQLRRYWELQPGDPIRYQNPETYVAHFQEIFRTAISDRLRTDRAGVLLSGGLDSASVTAITHQIFKEKQAQTGQVYDFRAYTTGYETVSTNRDRYYAGQVAQFLDIPHHVTLMDDFPLHRRYQPPGVRPVLPDRPFAAAFALELQKMASRSRVVLIGAAADPILYPARNYFVSMLRQGHWVRFVWEVGGYTWEHRRLPQLYLRTALALWWAGPPRIAAAPPWISKALLARIEHLPRWDRLVREAGLDMREWVQVYVNIRSHLFETRDPAVTFAPVEMRDPWLDIRLMSYMLSIPPIPWRENKHILRSAMQGLLPEAVRLRPKETPPADLGRIHLRRDLASAISLLRSTPGLAEYVDIPVAVKTLQQSCRPDAPPWDQTCLAPLSLAVWLQRRAGPLAM